MSLWWLELDRRKFTTEDAATVRTLLETLRRSCARFVSTYDEFAGEPGGADAVAEAADDVELSVSDYTDFLGEWADRQPAEEASGK